MHIWISVNLFHIYNLLSLNRIIGQISATEIKLRSSVYTHVLHACISSSVKCAFNQVKCATYLIYESLGAKRLPTCEFIAGGLWHINVDTCNRKVVVLKKSILELLSFTQTNEDIYSKKLGRAPTLFAKLKCVKNFTQMSLIASHLTVTVVSDVHM